MENGLEKLVSMYEEAADASLDARQKSERCRDYYDGKQLTESEVETLRKRGQPPIVINRIQPKVDFLLGFERQTRTDPKAFPRTPQHSEDAESVTDAIRYVCDNVNFDEVASDVFENQIIEGIGGAIVEVKPKKNEIEIKINRVPWDRFFYDPHSVKRDFSDASYMGVIGWKDFDEARRLYPESVEALETSFVEASNDSTYDDKPSHKKWVDRGRKRVMCVQIYYLENGVWMHAIYTKGGYLVKPQKSAYLDEDGEPSNPIIMASPKIDRDGCRYGHVSLLLDLQDEINKRRSKALHILNTYQTFSKEGMLDDVSRFKREKQKPDGHIEFPANGEYGRDFGSLPTNDMALAQFQLLQEAKNEIDAVSANAALAGKEGGAKSGRAIQALQAGGQTELGPWFDAHRHWKKRIYRAVWARIRQFWTEEKWIRVTDDENNMKWVGLNRKITLGEIYQQRFGMPPPQDPRVNMVAAIQNQLSEIDVDIIVDETPDVINIQSEQLELMAQLAQVYPDKVPFEAVLELTQLRNKDKILERLNGNPEQQAIAQQQQAAMQQMAMQDQMERSQLEKQKIAAEGAKIGEEAKQKAVETQLLLANPYQANISI